MNVKIKEPAKIDPNCDIEIGSSSWDSNCISIKYAWKTSDGKTARGGEIPIEALPQMLDLSIKNGYLTLA